MFQSGIFMLVYWAIIILMIYAQWRVYVKAGKPGWASIIPFYNIIVELEIIGKPIWWLLLLFVPIANLVIIIMMALELAKRFGKSQLFGVFGLILFPFIGWLILGFDNSVYSPPEIESTAPAPTPVAPAQAGEPAPTAEANDNPAPAAPAENGQPKS